MQRLVVHPAEHQDLAGVMLLHDCPASPWASRLRRAAMSGAREVMPRCPAGSGDRDAGHQSEAFPGLSGTKPRLTTGTLPRLDRNFAPSPG